MVGSTLSSKICEVTIPGQLARFLLLGIILLLVSGHDFTSGKWALSPIRQVLVAAKIALQLFWFIVVTAVWDCLLIYSFPWWLV